MLLLPDLLGQLGPRLPQLVTDGREVGDLGAQARALLCAGSRPLLSGEKSLLLRLLEKDEEGSRRCQEEEDEESKPFAISGVMEEERLYTLERRLLRSPWPGLPASHPPVARRSPRTTAA